MQGNNVKAGWIYIFTNPSYSEVKIGKTTRVVEIRRKELSGATGVPKPFEIFHTRLFQDCHQAEKEIHTYLDKDRAKSVDREFFSTSTFIAMQVVDRFYYEEKFKNYDAVITNLNKTIDNQEVKIDILNKTIKNQEVKIGILTKITTKILTPSENLLESKTTKYIKTFKLLLSKQENKDGEVAKKMQERIDYLSLIEALETLLINSDEKEKIELESMIKELELPLKG